MSDEMKVPESLTPLVGPDVVERGYWIDANGYYEGDRQPKSIAVPQRPTASHEFVNGAWELSNSKQALMAITRLEQEQEQRITSRAQRELYLGIFASLGLTAHPAFAALKAIDDQIKLERKKL